MFTPAAMLRVELERFRGQGIPFDEAFGRAKLRVTHHLQFDTTDRVERMQWLEAFEALRPIWEAAYNGADSFVRHGETVPFPDTTVFQQHSLLS